MKTPAIITAISILIVLALVALAFIFIDIAGHKSFYYEVTRQGEISGAVILDRYITEDKLLYKARGVFPFSSEYPSFNSSLALDKSTKMPSKYFREELGVKGQKVLTSLVQKKDMTDYLFLENPRFLKIENFSTGEKTSVYYPDDPMLVTALMERYNYWKKGTQYFEVMIPYPGPFPPLRDKVSVRHIEEEYIPVMGRKIEADIYVIESKALKETRIGVSKSAHRLLTMESAGDTSKYALVSVKEGPDKLSVYSMKNLPFVRDFIKGISNDDEVPSQGHPGIMKKISEGKKVIVPGVKKPKEVFFESGNVILSADLWVPEAPGPFPAVLLVPGESPRRSGESYFMNYLGSFMADNGYMVLSFDPPGQGKSQGSFYEMDDVSKVKNVLSALKFLSQGNNVASGKIVIIAEGSSGNAAIEAVLKEEVTLPCVLISPEKGISDDRRGQPPIAYEPINIFKGTLNEIFDPGFLSKASMECAKHLTSIEGSSEDLAYFMGVKLPVKGYREYIKRRPYQKMLSCTSPILVVMGRNSLNYDKEAMEVLRSDIRLTTPESDVVFVDKLETYGGSIKFLDGKWEYVPQSELFIILKSWIDKVMNGIKEKNIPVSIV